MAPSPNRSKSRPRVRRMLVKVGDLLAPERVAERARVAEEQATRHALFELYGSYQALAGWARSAQAPTSDPMQWDGPICARRVLGLEDAS